MKIFSKLFLAFLVTAIVSMTINSEVLFAGTTNKYDKKAAIPALPPQSQPEIDPATDQLPGWLLLPEGLDEAQVSVRPGKNPGYIIVSAPDTQEVSGKWTISIKDDGKRVRYVYQLNSKTQFSVLTTANYPKMVIFDSKNKKVKSISAEEFFDAPIASASANCKASDIGEKFKFNCKNINSIRKNKKLSKRQINNMAYKAGIANKEHRRLAVAIAMAESGGKIGAVLCNSSPPKNPKYPFERGVKECGDNSADRGVWQINNYWHKGVKDKCAFSPKCNTRAMYKISRNGTNWTPWSTYQNDSYRTHL